MPLTPPVVNNKLLAGIIFFICGLSPVWSQSDSQTAMSDIFFLDLGIVIEPVTGREKYSRLIESPSEEVTFRINKIKSGAVYMATSKEMMGTLDRINLRIASLEQSFHAQMERLQRENEELRGILEEMKNTPPIMLSKPYQSQLSTAKIPESPRTAIKEEIGESLTVATPPAARAFPPIVSKTKFDQAEYMSGVFAYQREDFVAALQHFNRLKTGNVSPRTRANILYWTADAHQHLAEYDEAMQLLDQLLVMGKTDRRDDALVQKGLLYRKLGQEDLALLAFEKLVSDYPSSEYVKLARMELKKAEMIP